MPLATNIVTFIGIFLLAEAIFSIVYYFEGSELPHVFRAIRAVFGAYLVWLGTSFSIFRTAGLFWSQVAFFLIVGLSVLAGTRSPRSSRKGGRKVLRGNLRKESSGETEE